MADLTLTAASVAKGSGAQITNNLLAAETITAGCLVYEDTSVSPSVIRLTDCNVSAVKSKIMGVALHAALAGQPVAVQVSGSITIGATVGIGTEYYASTTAGSITSTAPASGSWASSLGFATTAALINIKINNSGVQVP